MHHAPFSRGGYALALLLALAAPAHSHERWGDGSAVPPWVKSACCGPKDVHVIDSSTVHAVRGGYLIDGLILVIPEARTFDSLDGQTWAFFTAGTPNAYVHCLFLVRGF